MAKLRYKDIPSSFRIDDGQNVTVRNIAIARTASDPTPFMVLLINCKCDKQPCEEHEELRFGISVENAAWMRDVIESNLRLIAGEKGGN